MYFVDYEQLLVHTVFSFSIHGLAYALCGANILTESHELFARYPLDYLQCKVCAEKES